MTSLEFRLACDVVRSHTPISPTSKWSIKWHNHRYGGQAAGLAVVSASSSGAHAVYIGRLLTGAVVTVAASGLALSALLGFVTYRRIVGPVHGLQRSVESIAKGDYAAAVKMIEQGSDVEAKDPGAGASPRR